MDQDRLKVLLQMVICQTENNQLSTIDDIITIMQVELEKLPSIGSGAIG